MNRSTPRPSSSSRSAAHGSQLLSASNARLSRPRTPVVAHDPVVAGNPDVTAEDDPRIVEFTARYDQTIARLDWLFRDRDAADNGPSGVQRPADAPIDTSSDVARAPSPPKRPARKIDEDDYGDEDEEEDEAPEIESPLKFKSNALPNGRLGISPGLSNAIGLVKPVLDHRSSTSSGDQPKSAEDVRKKLQEEKQAKEEEAKRHFNAQFYTLENDKRAMLEQQKLDELDRQVESEMSGDSQNRVNGQNAAGPQQGSLSSANLGATSLMLKHLLARIDSKRHMVHAQDSQLRRLISEVRKNRSKWASEDKVGQEELYETAERVLGELKAMTENSGPFLQKVNKREAPDYYNVIKHPMDIGTMQKKLKSLQYKSRQEFVSDLYLIWSNCLKYNSDPNHPLRRKALIMQKHTDRLVVLIPDITVRDRAEVEAEERRLAQNADADADGVEDSEDDMPIKASRGRKAPSKKGKKGTNAARKAPPAVEGTPGAETKPNIRHGSTRADSDAPMEGMVNGFTTPPPGRETPHGPNGVTADASEIDNAHSNDLAAEPTDDPELDDFQFRLWKQTTKKARAQIASERHRLFRADRINGDEPALLRSKAGMRRFMRQQKQVLPSDDANAGSSTHEDDMKDRSKSLPGETLAEGMEEEEDNYLPEHYNPVSGIPDIDERLRWEDDEDGDVIMKADECLRLVPSGMFRSPESKLTKKIAANMRQMQDTRKVCAKIGIVKQMQIQSQMYQNQFQKYDPQPFEEADIAAHVVTDEGPIMAPWVCRAALERSVAKICYHTGFEEFQPSALESITDVAAHFVNDLVATLKGYVEAPKVAAPKAAVAAGEPAYRSRYSFEESVLHSLDENGVELEALEGYARDEIDRLNTKLGVMHERMKSHLAELLRPALDPNTAGADGVGAFNDGSEQFVGGDFAGDIDEDFFGFKELGLDKELGLASLSVPFHLLQNRMHNAYQSQNASATSTIGALMPEPSVFEAVTVETLPQEIGLIRDFFAAKLAANNNAPLIEDDELPAKQRFPKPRLPPSGKISSPRKRPLREQQQLAKKKRKLEMGLAADVSSSSAAGKLALVKPAGKLKLEMPAANGGPFAEPEKEDEVPGMMSPESM